MLIEDSQYDKWEFKCPTTLHRPFTRVKHPTGPADLTLALLLASQAHLGHSPSLWNTKTQAYIYGIRQGVHIISLDATLSHLKLAASVVRGVSANGGLILFVGTRSGQDQAIVGAARRTGGYHLFHRWLPGAITNGEYVIGRGRLKAEPVDPRKLEFGLPPQPPVIPKALKPDLVVIMNPLENHVLLRECTAHRIPTIGIIDTNADPSLVTYAIPANDDSLRCVEVIAGTLGRAGEDGRLEREARDKRRNMRIAMKEIKAVDGKVTIRVAEHA
ncbi:37S ribosomal protein MRP4, mitochondrial [Neolecta irregularis DAH-3]|uniref:37S ribosomal protein MRP4, mitochondrial n=1 Tax=Neolecta irregularis (strain DAH-3) TaxID=1198029 RepID=A0A1U7LGU9_NEOID|nr:37S ribosomal protein MRP4, mitochondrial [Neolecta irregularis DAH-3]|eukprot:OLL21869.1 37S ribosomal protein MRP4, mitochondrial [Neolecta irregularis DAH-3]